jgi:hypothetical protein
MKINPRRKTEKFRQHEEWGCMEWVLVLEPQRLLEKTQNLVPILSPKGLP